MTAGVSGAPTTVVLAEPDRRFYAFALDRIIAWLVYAAVAVALGFTLFRHGSVLLGIVVLAVVVVFVWFVGALLTGLGGATPGKSALGLKVVSVVDGRPIGLGRALVRQGVLGVLTLPTVGLGAATLAWMATVDPTGQRRGLHDRLTDSIVVDVRRREAPVAEGAPAPPRRIVNLTAMRLRPAPAEPVEQAAPPPRRDRGTSSGIHPIVGVDGGPVMARHAAAQPVTPQATTFAAPSTPGVQQVSPMPVGPQPAAPQPPQHLAPQHLAPQNLAPAQPRTIQQPAQPSPQPFPGQAARPAQASPQPRQGQSTPATQPAAAYPKPAAWRVSFDTGESFVVAGLALVGRGPEPQPGEQVAHLVALVSRDMSLSKTHAQFQVAPDGSLVVMDRGSTNGSTLIRQGASRPLGSRKPATLVDGDRVRFGDREMLVRREG